MVEAGIGFDLRNPRGWSWSSTLAELNWCALSSRIERILEDRGLPKGRGGNNGRPDVGLRFKLSFRD